MLWYAGPPFLGREVNPDATGSWPMPPPYDFFNTTRMLRTGHRDPTLQREPDGLWRTAHTDDGPATVRLTVGEHLQAKAWGPGAEQVMQDVPYWAGLHEEPWKLPSHPATDRLLKQHSGLRGTDTRNMFEALTNAIVHQLITWNEAAAIWRRLCEELGVRAPGPVDMRLSPTPRAILGAGPDRLRSTGMGGRQSRALMELARVPHVAKRAGGLPTSDALELLQKIPGIGPWSASYALGLFGGRPEPVPLGDYNLPNTLAWVLAGEPRATEERMLELLEPFEGHAYRVVRLVFAAGIKPPRRGPRRARRW